MLVIPSAFSPNDDGINDVFKPQGQNIVSVQVEIYNRWGNKVYHEINTIPDMNGWDGTGQNGNCETGVYVYAITTQFVDGSETFYRGNITLIR
ncbi:MAG: gliding motility-associated C-terminal domain-containing protein [Sphingobacteriales bacterium]|nr:gliding motility-associated C-terminal domain-containing protein [Sphingobacteriales bacterium]